MTDFETQTKIELAQSKILEDPDNSKLIFEEILSKTGSELVKSRCLNGLAKIDWDKGLSEFASEKYEKSIQICQDHNYRLELVEALIGKAIILIFQGENDAGINLCNDALEKLTNKDEILLKIRANNSLAHAFYNKGSIEKSLTYYLDNQKILEGYDKYDYEKARISNNISMSYVSLGKIEEAAKYFKIAYDICKKLKFNKGIVVVSNNLAESLILLGKHNQAKDYFLEGIQVAHDNDIHDVSIEITYAGYLTEQGKFAEAHEIFEKLEKTFSMTKYQIQKIDLYSQFANFWIVRGNFEEAKKQLKLALDTIDKSELTEQRINILISLAQVYQGLMDSKKSFEYLIEADKYAWGRNSEVGAAQVLIEKGKINIEKHQYYEAELALNRAFWISEKTHHNGLQLNAKILLAQNYLIQYKKTKEKLLLQKASKNIEESLFFSKSKGLVPKYVTLLIIQGALYNINMQTEQAIQNFTEAIKISSESSLENLKRISEEFLALTSGQYTQENSLKDESDQLFLALAVDEIKKTTDSHYSSSITLKDLQDTFMVLFKVDEVMGPMVLKANNLDPEDPLWFKDLILCGSLYTSALGQGQTYHQGLFGILPFGQRNLRSLIFAITLNDSSQKQERQHKKAYFLFTLIFSEKLKPFFQDRQKLESIFQEEIENVGDINLIDEKWLGDLRKKILNIFSKDFNLSFEISN
ncbi:tetratricopeptide repeat protein [Candidatus Lokiarchaeum ossiferum]|uniref:tetratricopeptide repeat protein n=1 Tax=Candidatus Lokiarchaeum ossiferum TaxID=2951803 RepID=UPI00352FCF3E